MTDHSMIFSAPMTRALLDGRKTQTRRVLQARLKGAWVEDGQIWAMTPDGPDTLPLPYAPGNRLWVREAWETTLAYDDLKPSEMGGDEPIRYLADGGIQTWGWPVPAPALWGRYRHARHMPRRASRLTLTVTDVRVQRVQEISEGDALDEGVEADVWDQAPVAKMYGTDDAWFVGWPRGVLPPSVSVDAGAVCRSSFRTLWNSIHGPDAWDRNDWVAAYTFTVRRGNIDA